MKKLILFLSLILYTFIGFSALAETNLAKSLSGYILLQVESNGEAWYVSPANQNRYYLGLPQDAFEIMRNLSIGITNENLSKIPIGFINISGKDSDNDGLEDTLEEAIKTNPNNSDSDNDGFNDKLELENNYDPLNNGKLNIDQNLLNNNLGKIFLQVENNGEAWYIHPKERKRYFLGSPSNAFNVMRELGLGITNQNISTINPSNTIIEEDKTEDEDEEVEIIINKKNAEEVFELAYLAIMDDDKKEALQYFTEEMKLVVEHTMNTYNYEENFNLGNLMAGADLTYSDDTLTTYSTKVYFQGTETKIYFDLIKQDNGEWLLNSL